MMKAARVFVTLVAFLALFQLPAMSQTRDEKVRADRAALADDQLWHYNDLESGFAAAARDSKPLMVVLRCIP